MVLCDACGTNMTDDEGTSFIGLEIELKLPKKKPGMAYHEICRVRDTFGKTEFAICFVCWLKSLGIKEKGTK